LNLSLTLSNPTCNAMYFQLFFRLDNLLNYWSGALGEHWKQFL
jgi:hypothetical protein